MLPPRESKAGTHRRVTSPSLTWIVSIGFMAMLLVCSWHSLSRPAVRRRADLRTSLEIVDRGSDDDSAPPQHFLQPSDHPAHQYETQSQSQAQLAEQLRVQHRTHQQQAPSVEQSLPRDEKGISQLQQQLQPVKGISPSSHRCIERTRGYWTFEVCPGAEVRQFHQYVKGVDRHGTLSLGRCKAALLAPTGTETFVGGDVCQPSERPREATVSYSCGGGGNRIISVQEPEPCRYEIAVQLAIVCAPPPAPPVDVIDAAATG